MGAGPAAGLDSTRPTAPRGMATKIARSFAEASLSEKPEAGRLHAGICAGSPRSVSTVIFFICAQITLEAGSVLFGLSYLRNGI